MNKKEALELRDKYRPILIGKPFHDKEDGWDVIDVIISDYKNIGNICQKMYDAEINNDAALLFFNIPENSYDVFPISHQWSWGSGDLRFEKLESFLKHHHL